MEENVYAVIVFFHALQIIANTARALFHAAVCIF